MYAYRLVRGMAERRGVAHWPLSGTQTVAGVAHVEKKQHLAISCYIANKHNKTTQGGCPELSI